LAPSLAPNATDAESQTTPEQARRAGLEPATRCLEGTSCYPRCYLVKYLTAKCFRAYEMLASSVSIEFEAASPALASRSADGQPELPVVARVITCGDFRPVAERARSRRSARIEIRFLRGSRPLIIGCSGVKALLQLLVWNGGMSHLVSVLVSWMTCCGPRADGSYRLPRRAVTCAHVPRLAVLIIISRIRDGMAAP